MNNQLDKVAEALRALIEAATPFGYRDDDPINIAKAKARSVLAEMTMSNEYRWRCPCCKSDNVHISLPTWYRETTTHDLEFIDTDAEADISWWYCNECGETDSGQPIDADALTGRVRRAYDVLKAMHARIVTETADAIARERGLSQEPDGNYTDSIDVPPPCDSDEETP